MATPIRIKRSAVSGKRPQLTDLQVGELALNTYDGSLFTERDTGGVGIATTVSNLTPWTESYGASSISYLNSVGIGTIEPSTDRLRVVRDGLDKIIQRWGGYQGPTAGQRFMELYTPATDNANDYFRFQTGNAIKFRIDNTDALCINSSGNIGIGTDSPQSSLYVKNGHTRLEDTYIAGVATVSGAVIASVFGGSGYSLTNLNASNIGFGTIPDARFPATLPAISGASLTDLTGASAGTYGNSTVVPQIDVDANGRITGITNVSIAGGGGGGSSLIIKDSGSLVGTAGTIDFGSNLSVSPLSSGIVTVSSGITGIDTTGTSFFDQLNVSGISTFTGAIDANGGANISGGLRVSGVTTLGITTFGSQVNIAPNVTAVIGEFSIKHFPSPANVVAALTNHGTNFVLQQNEITIQDTSFNSSNKFFKANGTRTELYHGGDGSERLVTNGIGATVFGELDVTGDVGIGTDDPDQTLHVYKGSAGTVNSDSNAVATLENSNHSILQILSPADKSGRIMFGDPDDTNAGQISYDHNIDTLTIEVNGGEKLRIDSSGNLDVTGILTVSSDANFGGNVSIAGTLTYEDVTNIDSIGISTLGSGASGQVFLQHGGSTKLKTQSWGVQSTGVIQALSGRVETANVNSETEGYSLRILNSNGAGGVKELLELGHASSNSFITGHVGDISINAPTVAISTNMTVGGIVTATSFSGSGADITGISTLNITNYGVGISGAIAGIDTTGTSFFNQISVAGIDTSKFFSYRHNGGLDLLVAPGYDDQSTRLRIQSRNLGGPSYDWYLESNRTVDQFNIKGGSTSWISIGGISGGSGKVGINSTDPTSQLDVVGDVKISGIITAGSIVPHGTLQYDIGQSAKKYAHIWTDKISNNRIQGYYSQNIYFDSDQSIRVVSGSNGKVQIISDSVGLEVSPHTSLPTVTPTSDDTISLGTSSKKWSEVNATRFVGSGVSLTALPALANSQSVNNPAYSASQTFTVVLGSPYNVTWDHYAAYGGSSDRNGTVTGNDPTITVNVGDTLILDLSTQAVLNNAAGRTYIKTATGTGSGNQVTNPTATNNGSFSQDISWTPSQAGTYYYQNGTRANMVGQIVVNQVGVAATDRFISDINFNSEGRVTGVVTFNGYVAASNSTRGIVKIDDTNLTVSAGIVSVAQNINLPTGIITSSSFVKSGGTSSQYLMADGSVTTSGGGGGAAGLWQQTNVGINTLSKVGIGTTNPIRPLHIEDADCRIRLTEPGVATDVELINTGGNAVLTTNGASQLRLLTNNTERLVIASDGKIGIGTDTPQFNLDLGSYVSNNVSTASTLRIVGQNNSTAIRIAPGGTSSDITILRVDSKEGTTDGDTNNTFGFSLKYMGSGTGMANRLAIWPDNLNNTKYEAFSIFNTGKVALYDDNQGGYGFYGDPTHHFNVYGDCLIRGNIDINSDPTATTGAITIRDSDILIKNGSSTDKMFITKEGHVGIGTTNAFAPVSVSNTNVLAVGIVTANEYYGDGSKLTGISGGGGATGVSTTVGTFTIGVGSTANIDSFAYATNDYKVAEYTLHFMNGANIQAQKLLVMQDGTNVYSNSFGVMASSNPLVSVGSTIGGGNVYINVTAEVGVSGITTYRWRREVQE